MRDYFRLPDLAERWGCTEDDLFQWGENGILVISTKVNKAANGASIPYRGAVALRQADIGPIALHGQTEVDDFLTLSASKLLRSDEDRFVRPYEGEITPLLIQDAQRRAGVAITPTRWKSMLVKRESLVVLLEEAERFTEKYPELISGQSTTTPPGEKIKKEDQTNPGGRKTHPYTKAIEAVFLYLKNNDFNLSAEPDHIHLFLDHVRAFRKDEKKGGGFLNDETTKIVAENIIEVKRNGSIVARTLESEMKKTGKETRTYTRNDLSKKLHELRKKHRWPS